MGVTTDYRLLHRLLNKHGEVVDSCGIQIEISGVYVVVIIAEVVVMGVRR